MRIPTTPQVPPHKEGHWVTIGSQSTKKKGKDGKKKTVHKGGTPVFIKGDGKIAKGPSALVGENVAHLPERQDTQEAAKPAKPKESTKPAAPKAAKQSKETPKGSKKPKNVEVISQLRQAVRQAGEWLGLDKNSEITEELAALSGCPDDSKIEIYSDYSGKGIQVEVKHPHIRSCTRTIKRDSEGKLFIHNDILRASVNAPKGFGSDFFERQVTNAKEAGVFYLETHAAGEWPGELFNGYYTWPTLGYDQKISEFRTNIQEKIKASFPNAKSVLDIIDTKEVIIIDPSFAREIRRRCAETDRKLNRPVKDRTVISGSDWWLANGTDMEHAKFDLTEGSRSMKTLEAYMAKKRAKEGKQ